MYIHTYTEVCVHTYVPLQEHFLVTKCQPLWLIHCALGTVSCACPCLLCTYVPLPSPCAHNLRVFPTMLLNSELLVLPIASFGFVHTYVCYVVHVCSQLHVSDPLHLSFFFLINRAQPFSIIFIELFPGYSLFLLRPLHLPYLT